MYSYTEYSRFRYTTILLLSVWEETIVAGQIMVASLWKYACLQCPEHLEVIEWGEHCRTKTNSLFTWSSSKWLFPFFPHHQGAHFEGLETIKWSHNNRAEGHSRRILPVMHRRMGKCTDSRGVPLKGKLCSLLFGIEIDFLCQQSCYFSETPYI